MQEIDPIQKFLLFVCSLLFGCGCAKHFNDVNDHIPNATLKISSPVDGAAFVFGDTVYIKGIAISDEVIHGYDINIRKHGDTTSVFKLNVHDHNDTIVIDKKWRNDLVSAGELDVIVTLALDHEGHVLVKRVPVNVK